jgi:hypothetical protein
MVRSKIRLTGLRHGCWLWFWIDQPASSGPHCEEFFGEGELALGGVGFAVV